MNYDLPLFSFVLKNTANIRHYSKRKFEMVVNLIQVKMVGKNGDRHALQDSINHFGYCHENIVTVRFSSYRQGI